MKSLNVLLALMGDRAPFATALNAAGFSVVVPSEDFIAEELANIDLAVFDCDAAAEILAVRSALSSEVPALLLLGEGDIPADLARTKDDIALKPLSPESLVYRLQALLIRAGREVPSSAQWLPSTTTIDGPLAGESRIISVFAPKGGVGKTTVAVNIAVAMREQTNSQVLLFDADVGVGNITSVLDVPYSMGLADLADSDSGEWQAASFERLISQHAESGLDVLAWGNDPSHATRISSELLLAAINWAKGRYAYVVIDTHPGYDDRTMAMLSLAQEILLVVTPEVGSIRNSSQFLEVARAMGIRDLVKIVVNRANHGISLSDISSSLGVSITATVDSNGHKAVLASNEGQAIVSKYPREKIALDLCRLARLVWQGEVGQISAKKAHGWRSLVKARTSAG